MRDNDRAARSWGISATRSRVIGFLFSGFIAAIAGVVVNAAGLASGHSVATTIDASNWLYGLFIAVPLVTIPIVWSIVRNERPQPLEQPAE